MTFVSQLNFVVVKALTSTCLRRYIGRQKAKFHLFGYKHLAPGVAQLALWHCRCKIQEGLNPLVLEILSVCAPKTAFPEAIAYFKEWSMIHQNKSFLWQKKCGGVKLLGSQTILAYCPEDFSREDTISAQTLEFT